MAEVLKQVPAEDLKIAEKSDGSVNSTGAIPPFELDPVLERRTLWKRDLVLVPVMGVLYMLLFLDRTNIANARSLGIGSPTGLEGALGLPSNGYNVALAIFYIPFVLAEIPANLILKSSSIRPGYLLGGQMALLGVLGMCQGLTQSYAGLLVVRFIMGTFEAALPAGATYMIACYYPKKQAALRFAWFFNFALAGPFFSGLLAYAIQNLEGAGGYQGWRWIFIIEGLMTIVIAIPVVLFCPNFPSQAQGWFLKPAERDYVVAQLEASRGAELKGSAADNVPLWKVLLDWRIHLFSLCFFCVDITAASISAFSPTILTELGWSAQIAQVMSMPIWASGIVSGFAVTYIASLVDFRTPFMLVANLCQLAGWIIMKVYVPQAGVRYFALFLMSIGTFPQMPMLMGWLSANLRGHKYLAVGMGWMVCFGNCANFISSNVFIKTEAPKYPTAFSVGLGFTSLGFSLLVLGFCLLTYLNKQHEKKRAQLSGAEREQYDELYFKYLV